jgi:hypothetical protein
VPCMILAEELFMQLQRTVESKPCIFNDVRQAEDIMSRVRGSVTNNNGFCSGCLDLLVLLLQLLLITITYNSSQSSTV